MCCQNVLKKLCFKNVLIVLINKIFKLSLKFLVLSLSDVERETGERRTERQGEREREGERRKGRERVREEEREG